MYEDSRQFTDEDDERRRDPNYGRPCEKTKPHQLDANEFEELIEEVTF